MLVPMAKVQVIGLKSRLHEVLVSLHDYGSLHIQDVSSRHDVSGLDPMRLLESQLSDQERLEHLLGGVTEVLGRMEDPDPAGGRERRRTEYERLDLAEEPALVAEAERMLAAVEERTGRLASERAAAEDGIVALRKYEPVLRKIQPLASQVLERGSFDSIGLLMDARYRGALDDLGAELERIADGRCDVVHMDVDADTVAVIIVFACDRGDEVRRFLDMEDVQIVTLPEDLQGVPYDEAYRRVRERMLDLSLRASEIGRELRALADEWYDGLEAMRWSLADRVEQMTALPKLGETVYTFVITGWMPVDDLKWARKGLNRQFGGSVMLVQSAMSEHDSEEVPVEFRNPRILRPFQSLVTLMGMPSYGSIDPTWMIALFYPLFFGMIVGDVGYGLIMLSAVLVLRWRFRHDDRIRLATSVLGPATTMVVLFGFLYGEFFGDIMSHYLGWVRQVRLGPVSLPFHRIELMQEFMLIAVGLGFLQIVFGLVTGVVNGFRMRSREHVFEKAGMLAVLVGLPLLLGLSAIPLLGSSPLTPAFRVGAALLILTGLVSAFVGGSILGLVESVLQFSNVASYIRIMAVGLAGAIFADAVNHMVVTMSSLVVGVVMGLILHTLNLLIAAFSPTIHALRLNFLEFFGKFYEAGKQRYRPFRKAGSEEGTW